MSSFLHLPLQQQQQQQQHQSINETKGRKVLLIKREEENGAKEG